MPSSPAAEALGQRALTAVGHWGNISRVNVDSSHAFAAARRIFRRSVDPGLYLTTFCLPAMRRDALHALGACIALVQETISPSAGLHRDGGSCSSSSACEIVERVKQRIDAIWHDHGDIAAGHHGDETQWMLLAAAESVREFEIPQAPMLDLVDALAGAAMVTRYATWRSLSEHGLRTGGNVAILMTAILGATSSDAPRFAVQIGQAARLTCILRNLAADVSRGRMLIPLEDLARVRCSEKDILARRPTRAFCELIHLEIERARELLHGGSAGLCWLAGDGSRLAGAGYVTAQFALLDAMDRAPAEVLSRRVRVAPARQFRRFADAWRLAQRDAAQPLPRLA